MNFTNNKHFLASCVMMIYCNSSPILLLNFKRLPYHWKTCLPNFYYCVYFSMVSTIL